MKKVIRITESDLARIVKRVLNENAPGIIKIKTWNTKEDRDKFSPRNNNLNTTSHRLENNVVVFSAEVADDIMGPGYSKNFKGMYKISCGDFSNRIFGGDILYITDTARKLLTKKCDAYVSNDTKVNGDYV